MNELLHMNVKITFNNSFGYIMITGFIRKIYESFLLVETTNGPFYVSFAAIKTMQVIGDVNEKK